MATTSIVTRSKQQPAAVTTINAIITFGCCSWSTELSVENVEVAATAGGKTLGKVTCDACGSEYTLGVIAQTREESLASEAFEHVSEEVLDEVGVERDDYEPSTEDVAMCFGCDGAVDRRGDWCSGCKEFVCSGCRRYLGISGRRHPAEAHTSPPKAKEPLVEGVTEALEDNADFRAEAEE